MDWRLAASLEKLRAQINAAAPNRSKVSDGSIGDAAHASRSSDHNPWVRDGKLGVVTAIDITHDPADGVDAAQIAQAVLSDPRTKYVIWNRRIANPDVSGGAWRPYTGSNPHDKHVHISVRSDKAHFDSTVLWRLGDMAPDASAPAAESRPTLRKGSTGREVEELQKKLAAMLIAEPTYGPLTEGIVKGLQQSKGLHADGVTGPYTWGHVK
jgi:hypothetical protein